MWLPRFAYNDKGEIIHIKQGHSVAGTWVMPEIFIHETEKIDLSLAGVWVEYNPLASTSEVTTKINNMTGEENQYGFIANTKPIVMTQNDLITIQKYIVGVDAHIDPINDITNSNRTILKIINTNQLEPIKGKATLNAEELTISIEITYRTHAMRKILDSNGRILSENSTTAIDTELLGNGTYTYIVIDNVGNIREITIKVEGLKIYIIPNLQRLKEFRDEVNSGNTFSGITVIQTADIQMNEGKYTIDSATGEITFADDTEQWEPIGNIGVNSNLEFNGTYEGNNHTISGIYINDVTLQTAGLFGFVSGSVKNLNVKESYIHGKQYVGAIAGQAYNLIENCSNSGTISSTNGIVGGICGVGNGSTITGCYNIGIVKSSNTNYIGGICGLYGYIIKNCYNLGDIKGENSDDVGGICGFINTEKSEIKNCYNYGNIVGDEKVAGIIGNGHQMNVIENCYNVGNVTGTGNHVAGINGYTYRMTSISNCYNTADISGKGYLSGILSYSYYTSLDILNCYNSGTISGTGNCIGGILGMSNTTITIESAYNAGTIYGKQYVGGIAGENAYATSGGTEVHNAMINSYNYGEVTGTTYVGGCSGRYRGNSSANYLKNYNLGQVTGTSYIGGITGYKSSSNSTISSCYYETGTASYGVGSSGTNGNNTGCTATTRQSIISYITALDEYQEDTYNINNGLPILAWQTDNDKLNLINGDNAFVEDTEGINNGYPLLAWQVE